MATVGARRRPKRPRCPYCGYEDQVVRIFYGLPAPELIEQARRKEIALGGACIGPDAYEWYCKGCLQSFRSPGFRDELEAAV